MIGTLDCDKTSIGNSRTNSKENQIFSGGMLKRLIIHDHALHYQTYRIRIKIDFLKPFISLPECGSESRW